MINLYEYRGEVIRVVDGDTLEVLVDQGFDDHALIRVRLLDVNTAEIFRTKNKDPEEYARGIEARNFVLDWIHEHAEIVTPNKPGMVNDLDAGFFVYLVTQKDKRTFTRYVGTIYPTRDDTYENSLNYALIQAGHHKG